MAPAVSAPASPRHSTQCLLLPTRDDSSLPLHAHDDVDDHAEVTQSSKIKSLLGILKKVVGVKDLAAIRLSLPSHLIEPVPNLEYWTYFDRADLFATIPDFDQPLDRMLAVLRFTLSKDLKVIRNGVCKPYNSVLGEYFRCHWDVRTPVVHEARAVVPVQSLQTNSPLPLPLGGDGPHNPNSADSLPKQSLAQLHPGGNGSDVALDALSDPSDQAKVLSQERRIAFLTEQVSHHPPISTFYAKCPSAGIEASGVDQLSARFTGTSVRVYAGEQNRGVFFRLTSDAVGEGAAGEEYRMTHPAASINGLLRGSLWVSMAEATVIDSYGGSRPDDRAGGGGTRLRAVIEYKDEAWIGRAKYALEGVIYEYDWRPVAGGGGHLDGEQAGETYWTKVKQVPADRVVATFEGQWNGKVTFRVKGNKESRPLINLPDLDITPKTVRGIDDHEPMESRRIWAPVTDAIQNKKYSDATNAKKVIEQQQRELAAERERANQPFVPHFFLPDFSSGRPALTPAGEKCLRAELASGA